MQRKHNKDIVPTAKMLRKNMTKEEKHLWYDFLKQLPITVNRQRKIKKYIVDFYLSSAKLVIELDGSQHYEPDNRAKDAERDKELADFGIKVLRYTNKELNDNFYGVCEDILKNISRRRED
jgi:very-short-patch-repair endonuclease